MSNRSFFLGRIIDTATGQLTDQPLYYDSANLTTHGIITGMTGSGKTGLGVAMLEEAALAGIPAIVIDPKGDLTNLLLHFPELAPADFAPWLDPEAARRSNLTPDELAAETAANWRKGLAAWGLGREQLLALQEAAQFTIFTPGSAAGVPVNVLSSFSAPDLDWETNREILREKISTIVTALLGLIGLGEVDPLRSRDHILLANIIEYAWSRRLPLDLGQLIMQTQRPPFDRLGAFPLESFYPEKDRFSLAMLLNNFLASPSFQAWLEGQPLDIGAMLYTAAGKPRHNVFYLAHLSEPERQFTVTMLFAAIESWMRSQRGTAGLRLLIYFDEIVGYMPPVANPPPRVVMLRMLKQARAFGVGLVLATQNPVDVDYKGLSNAGTWIIGRLQTERDKERLMDGLRGASGVSDIGTVDRLISGLGKRQFLLHSVHASKPVVFGTRWVLNFLAGPLMRAQIPALNRLAGVPETGQSEAPAAAVWTGRAQPPEPAPAAFSGSTPATGQASILPPVVPSGVEQVFLTPSVSWAEAVGQARLTGAAASGGLLYKPALLAQAEVRFSQRRYGLDHSVETAALVDEEPRGRVEWAGYLRREMNAAAVGESPVAGVRYGDVPNWLSDVKRLKALEREFADWLYQTSAVRIRLNETLRVYAGPEVSEDEFVQRLRAAARDGQSAEQVKLEAAASRKVEALRHKVQQLEMQAKDLGAEVSARRIQEIGSGIETVLGMFGAGRKRALSTSMTRRRMTVKAGSQLEQTEADLAEAQRQLAQAEELLTADLRALGDRWAALAAQRTEVPVAATRAGIFVKRVALAWVPYHLARVGSQDVPLPAF